MYKQAALRAEFLQPTQRHIRKHKPINTQKPYNLRKSAYIAQSRTRTYEKTVQPTQSRIPCAKLYTYVRKICTTYVKPYTLRKVVHIRTQKPYNLRKTAYIIQIRTNTYEKDAHRFIKY